MSMNYKQMLDENRIPFYPLTNLESVRDENGKSILDYLGNSGTFMTAETEEDGVFFVDSELNVGLSLDTTGVKAKGILPYQIIDY